MTRRRQPWAVSNLLIVSRAIVKTTDISVYSNKEYISTLKTEWSSISEWPIWRSIGVGSIFLYMSLALVLTWTVRLARAKASHPWVNPWVYGCVAVGLMFLGDPWQLLSVLPMVILLFLKAPQPQSNLGPEGSTCARCLAKHPHGRYYCTSCGWELAKPYPEDIAVAGEKAPAPPRVDSRGGRAGRVDHRDSRHGRVVAALPARGLCRGRGRLPGGRAQHR